MPDDLLVVVTQNYTPDSQLLLANAWERAGDDVRRELAESITSHRLRHARHKQAAHAAEYLMTLDSQLHGAEVAKDEGAA